MSFFLVFAGFVVLLTGAEFLVRGAVGIAQRLSISPLVIGLTVVAFGTSSPELVVSVTAAIGGSPDIALGNVVGSNICNVLMVLGLTALITPIACTTPWMARDITGVLGATILMIGLGWISGYGFLSGIVFLVLLAAYLGYCYQTERRAKQGQTHAAEVEEIENVPATTGRAAFVLTAGLVAVIAGSELLVSGATQTARQFGVSEAAIGLTMVAFGTSLPELATSVVAALRRHDDIAAGNILGSNLFNILGVMGAASLFTHISAPASMLLFDYWVMLGSVLILIPYMVSRRRISRLVGILFVLTYGAFVVAQFVGLSGMPNHG